MEYDGGSDDTLQTQPVEEPGERPEENSAEEVKDQAVEEVQAQAVETPEEEAQEQAVEQAVEQTEEQIEPEQAQEQVQEQTQDRAQDQSTQEIKEQAIVLTQEQAAKEAQEEAQEHVAEEAQEEVTAGESQAQPLEESGEHHEEEGANVENSTEYHEQALEEAVEEPQELSKEFRLKEEQLLSEDYQENKMPEHLKNPEPEYPQESTKNDSPIMAPWNPSTTKYFQPNESTTLVLVFDEAQETAPDSMPESKDTGSSAPITFFMTPSGTPEIQEAPVPPQTENIDKFPAQSESKDIYLDPPQGTTPSPDIPVPTPERTVRSDHKETTVIVNVAQITGFVLVGMFLSVLIVMLLVWCSQPLWWPWAQMLLLKSRKTKELTSKAAEGLEADPEGENPSSKRYSVVLELTPTEILDTPDAEVNVPQTVGMDGANSDLMASESIGSAVVATGSQGYHGGGALLHPAQRTGWYQQPMLARRVSREMAPRGRVRDLEALFNDASSASD